MTTEHFTDHPSEDVLERFLLSPGDVGEAAGREIASHLGTCAACSALLADLRALHEDVRERLGAGPTGGDERFAARIGPQRRKFLPAAGIERVPDEALEGYAEVVEPTGGWLVRRIARYVRAYPVRSTTAVSFAGALAVLSFLLLRPSPDVNPVYAKFANNRLHVFNLGGDTLWTRLAPGVSERGSEFRSIASDERVALVEDIDGDGLNEVIVNPDKPGSTLAEDTLYCFDGTSALKWKAGCGPVVRLGSLDYTQYANWRILSFFTVRLPGERRPRFFLTAQAVPYMTSKLSEISPDDGRELRAYWHAGGLVLDALCDLAGDSVPELVLGAINNAYRSAAVIVLDPKDISGYGATTPDYVPEGMPRARELHYVTLTPSDVSEAVVSHLYNRVIVLTAVNPSTIRVHTDETPQGGTDGGIIYTFGKPMELLSASPDDPFIKTREGLVGKGRLTGGLDRAYLEGLRAGVKFIVRDGKPGPR